MITLAVPTEINLHPNIPFANTRLIQFAFFGNSDDVFLNYLYRKKEFMNGYLLLRNNKQTGPYSKEEIIEKGFKPYDLIWAEGKSAGWRYPGELPEFAAFAPMVEEQPFDRFFKKPSASSAKTVNPPVETINEKRTDVRELVVTEQSPAKIINIQSRKIFVTLPGTSTVPKPLPAANKPAPVEDLIPGSVSISENKFIPVEKEKVIAEKEKEIIEKNTFPVNPAPSYASFQQTNQFITDRLRPDSQDEKLFIPSIGKKNSTRGIFTGAVAACLLFGGIIIGLLISNGKQSQEKQQLSERLSKIKQRNTDKKQMTDQPVTIPQPIVNDPSKEPEPVNNEEQKSSQVAINSESNKEVEASTKNNPSSVITVVQKEKGLNKTASEPEITNSERKKEVDPEAVRSNLYSLISVESSPYKTGVLGGISNLELTISNNSLYPVDQVEVLINYHNIEKRIVKKQTVVIADVAAGEQKTISVPKSNRGVSISYSIIKISSRAIGVAHSGL